MNTLIIYSGHLGSTKKAAKFLAEKVGNAELIDTADKPKIDFKNYDSVVFGTNVRMFKPNKRFRKYAKKFTRSGSNAAAYVFVVGADDSHAIKNVETAKSFVKNCRAAVHAGGVLNALEAKGLAKKVIESIIESNRASGKEQPKLDYESLDKIADAIGASARKTGENSWL